MILTIIALLIAIIGTMILIKSEGPVAENIGIASVVLSYVAAIVIVLMILVSHVGVSATIAQNQIEYEALCERQEIIKSEYEDVSKSDVIKDIAEWNQEVYSYKHWAYNPWTSWFFSKKVADNMEMIE